MHVEQKVKLLIIDEVHLLHEDRGAVIESIVARTQRQVESMQSLIRIVGLSATLPNYVDVADFLGVNRYTGLFFFDSSFRPVPLEQHFVGVKGKPGSMQSRTNLDQAAFDKVAQLVKDGHQCMVFVHARKDTVKTAQTLREKAIAEGIIDLLDPSAGDDTNGKWQGFKRDLAGSRNREMKELAASGFGIHHAGMLRSDRNISERMFENNVTKVRSRSRFLLVVVVVVVVELFLTLSPLPLLFLLLVQVLCCTATLAWGVNLPAYAVVIKGTQVYDAGKGAFVDLSILDVLQIFGRAGRPQYEDQGVGYICTTSDKLDHYGASRPSSFRTTFSRTRSDPFTSPPRSLDHHAAAPDRVQVRRARLSASLSAHRADSGAPPAGSSPASSTRSTPRSASGPSPTWTRACGGSATRTCSCACARTRSCTA